MGKAKHFIQAKTLNEMKTKKKLQKIQPLTLSCIIFHEKGTPFVFLLSVANGSTSTYPV